MKLLKSIILLLLFPSLLFAQKSIEQEDVMNIVIPRDDSTINVGILVKSKTVKIKNNLDYYWYKSNKLYKNRGGFDGNLLHGKYNVYNSDGELMRSGEFKKGLMSGYWKTWYNNGELESVTKWKNGKLNGRSDYYSVKGELTKSFNYKNDILHNKTFTYNKNGTVKEIKFYKNGTLKLNFIDEIYIWYISRKNKTIQFDPEPIKKEKKAKEPEEPEDN